ncbi:MAG: hypothetical protein LC754_08800, partial [Acidobacteria bacterium]|nr:hypothetical protein [Acidobacteriota bacterium]
GRHDKHCFIVMPFGRDATEQKWFRGWYEVVIKPAVLEAEYEAKLAADEEQPGAINDKIRTHLALDPMVVVDLGGAEPEDEPNPNVMYELGIRHALGLPLVIIAWKGQRLPFDVSNQRVITEDRDLIDLEQNKKRLISFIHAAQQGKYYRPMEAVGRHATIQAASDTLGEDSLLRALAQEVRDLRFSISRVVTVRESRRWDQGVATVKKLVRGKVFRKDLYPHFVGLGGDASTWARLLRTRLSPEQTDQMQSWQVDEWKEFITARWAELLGNGDVSLPAVPLELDLQVLETVKTALPPQPWPKGVHVEVAAKIDLNEKEVRRYIRELIRRGDFMEQVDGELFPPGERN